MLSKFFETLWKDIRHGGRVLLEDPGFTIVAVLTLAIGIGANTSIFSLAYQLLLRPLPVPASNELVILRSPGPIHGSFHFDGDISGAFSYPMYRNLRDRLQVFSGLLARFPATVSVAGRGFRERAGGELVSGNYFEVLGVQASIGRVFSMQDETLAGANPVAVLSYGYWTRRFGADANLLNTEINVNGVVLTIVGVASPGFSGVQNGLPRDIFIPVTMKSQITPHWNGLEEPADHWLALMARLRPGFTREQAETSVAATYHVLLQTELPLLRIPEADQPRFLAKKLVLDPGSRGLTLVQQDAQEPLLFLTIMVALILVITCVNLASLMIAKGESRRREIAVRLALGATRIRLLRQLLTESFIVASFGGIAGLALAIWVLNVLVVAIRQSAGILDLGARLDARLLGYAIAVSIVTALLFGLAPALKLIRIDPKLSLGSQINTRSGSSFNIRLRKWLMVFQVAITVMLVAGAGLFTESLLNLKEVNLGLRADHIFEFSLSPELNHYSAAQTIDLADRLRHNLERIPGVTKVSAAEFPLLTDAQYKVRLTIEGQPARQDESGLVQANWVSPEYFSGLGIPLKSGRELADIDGPNSPRVAVVNESLVRQFLAKRNPLSTYIGLGSKEADSQIQIVGIVKDSKHNSVRDGSLPFVYLPYAQNPVLGQLTFYVRTLQDPQTIESAVTKTVEETDSSLPLYDKKTLSAQVIDSIVVDRLLALLSLTLGSVAALIAAVGLYGVMAYVVAHRIPEIGVRIALGATRPRIAWLVLREVLFMALVGLTIGLVVILVSSRVLKAILFGVSGTNPLILGLTAGSVAFFALLVGCLPAFKAAGLNPTVALRYE